MEFLIHVSKGEHIGVPMYTFNAIADEKPGAEVIEGAVYGVHPSVGVRNALSRRLSDPLLNSTKGQLLVS